MMANKKETAEQKLLKMIEAAGTGGPELAKLQTKTAKKQNVLTVVRASNRLLLVGVIVCALLLANEVMQGMNLLGRSVRFSVDQGMVKRAINTQGLIPTIQKISFYLAGPKRRNIFEPYEKKVAPNTEMSEKNRLIAQKTSHLRLVGIAWLDRIDTASAMIEDTQKNITYFLRQGEQVDDINIKTIYADGVALGYENEEIIIRYDKPQM